MKMPGVGKLNIRFAIGTAEGPRSGIWRAWTTSKKSDVYIAARGFAGELKVSLHESGKCYLGVPSERIEDIRDEDDRFSHFWQSRHMQRWNRANIAQQVTLGLTIIFPTSELLVDPWEVKAGKEVIWIPPAPTDQAVHLYFMFSEFQFGEEEYPGMISEPKMELFARHCLPNGQNLYVVYCNSPRDENLLREDVEQLLASHSHKQLDKMEEMKKTATGELRAIIMGRHEDGVGYLADMAFISRMPERRRGSWTVQVRRRVSDE